ncbi:MAG: hypothetical protein K5829_06450 [Treponema sp.]|nr:hypothetical protein [Treponema sp.]
MNNELFSTGGYNLDYFQILNWGTFDKKIYTLNAKNKTTLLTGENGSGKTTLVDALLTLLVPNDKRFYNQSSGEAKKRDRSEESYVLGAYGSMLTGEDDNSSIQYLRKREDTISILNGCFTNPFEQKSITLLQIRYFTNSNMQQVFAITEGKLSIEDINKLLQEQNIEIIRNKKWKDILTSNRGTAFYPSFKQYASAYSRIFGFRSEKALTLFSQIVGLKVLGDINSFIKLNMLEEGNIIDEFDKFQENYTNLVHCSNIIKKTRIQIEKFKSVNDTGLKYLEEKKAREDINSIQETIPYWYMKNADSLLSEELYSIQEKLKEEQESLNRNSKELETIEKDIESINHSIAQDSNTLRLKEIDNKLETLNAEKERKQKTSYEFSSNLLKLNLKLPTSAYDFGILKSSISTSFTESSIRENELEEEIRQKKNELDAKNEEIKLINSELKSLSNRDSNIPDSNILIRNTICNAINVDENQLPFAGELLCVKEEAKVWNNAIEKVLHNFALTIIVPDEYYKDVSTFVDKTNMKGRVVYIKAENDVFDLGEEINFAEDSIGCKLAFKETNPLCRFVKKYINEHFSYKCTNDINEYTSLRKAVTESGLIKSELKNEKDDRPNRNTKTNWVLGWNNKEKRTLLSHEYDLLLDELTHLNTQISQLINEKSNMRHIQDICNMCSIVTAWDEIDVESVIKQIDSVQSEKNNLLKSNSTLADLNKQLDQLKFLKDNKKTFINNLYKIMGTTEQKNKDITEEFDKNTKQLKELENAIDFELLSSNILSLESYFPRLSKAKTYSDLKNNKESIENALREKSGSLGKILGGYETQLKNLMDEAIHPSSKSIREKYGDWSADFSDLRATLDYLDDFIKVYNRLENDDLPKYTNRFHEYLHTALKEDFTGFQRSLQNQQQEIKQAITSLNQDLKRIAYNKNPDTYLQLEWRTKNDVDIKEFTRLLNEAKPDAMLFAQNNPVKEEEQFEKIQKLLNTLNEDERFKKKVLDVRNWFQYGAKELYMQDNCQKQYYSDSSSLSGGQKTKLTYTILAAAISYQFGIAASTDTNSSFRFVIIDEAFSKIDTKNSEQVMSIFNELDIQVMVVTPNDKINVVEDYISSIHLVDKYNTNDSRLIYMDINEYEEKVK